MYKRVIKFIEKPEKHIQQFGFRKNHSTEMAIINLTTKLVESIEQNEFTAGIFLDLSKAFDTIDHSIVIIKPQHYEDKRHSPQVTLQD